MSEASAHRGPDGIRYRIAGAIGFSHLALNATPESVRERQPVAAGEVWLTADLRLDNRGELIRQLRTDGFLPLEIDAGDAEIALAAYLRWGEGCAKQLLGDFALAVWDGRIRQLLLIRDPLGVKSLCHARLGSLVCFASEAQQILQHPSISRALDEKALADHLAGWPQEQECTFFRMVRRLPPAHFLVATPETSRLERYWNPARKASPLSPEESAEGLRHLFQQAVADRLRTNGATVGITLSGGLDSPSVAAVAQRHLHTLAEPRAQLLGCSFIFNSLNECDERVYIQHLATTLDLEVAWIDAESHWLLDRPEIHVPPLESPFMGWQSCQQQALTLLKDRGTRVLLTGQGGDDLLRGSPFVLLERLLRGEVQVLGEIYRHGTAQAQDCLRLFYRLLLRRMVPASLETGVRRLIGRELPSTVPEWITTSFAERTGLAERLATRSRRPGGLKDGALQDIYNGSAGAAYYERVVSWYDRNAAAFGIEVRHPFLDRRLFDFVLSVPPEQLFELGRHKPLLREAVAGILHDTLRLRTDKSKLGRYVDLSLREKAADTIEELLRAPLLAELGLVDREKLHSAYQEYRYGTSSEAKRLLWFPLTLELWLRHHHGGLCTAGRNTAIPATLSQSRSSASESRIE